MIEMSGDMTGMHTSHDPSGPLSWRDVYRAVNESEQRIIRAVNDAVGPLAAARTDHEVRIRALEIGGSPHAQQLQRDVDAQGIRITAAEKAQDLAAAKAGGIISTFSATQKFILTMAAAAGVIIAVLDLISRLAT